jgi:hypothetical protein
MAEFHGKSDYQLSMQIMIQNNLPSPSTPKTQGNLQKQQGASPNKRTFS